MTVQEEVRQRIERDALLAKLRGKIGSGKGTYADTAAYSNRAGKLLGEIFSRRLPEIHLSDREALCAELLHDRYTDINALCDAVQEALDKAQGLHLRPQHAPFDTKRAHQIGGSTVDPTKPEDVRQRRARAATETMTKAMHDDRIKAEAKFRHRAGLNCRITRVAVNGCCGWCSDVAGRYRYGEEPEKIYQRHDNCDCTVTFENGRKRQDVWSKREWESPEPGAGAGEPVVLTEEQAKALQKEKQLHVLTNDMKSGTMESEKNQLSRYVGQPIFERDNQHVREWYVANVLNIREAIDSDLPLEDQARQAYEARNRLKRKAREAMSDRESAELLERKRPAPTFEELVNSKMKRKGMSREDAIRDILDTATKTNPDVNKEFGL